MMLSINLASTMYIAGTGSHTVAQLRHVDMIMRQRTRSSNSKAVMLSQVCYMPLVCLSISPFQERFDQAQSRATSYGTAYMTFTTVLQSNCSVWPVMKRAVLRRGPDSPGLSHAIKGLNPSWPPPFATHHFCGRWWSRLRARAEPAEIARCRWLANTRYHYNSDSPDQPMSGCFGCVSLRSDSVAHQALYRARDNALSRSTLPAHPTTCEHAKGVVPRVSCASYV